MSFTIGKRLVAEGDTVILYVGVSQIYAIEVKPKILNRKGQLVDYVFQTRYGALNVMSLIGEEYGSKIYMSKGYAYILYPTPELWTLTLPHRTQILYTPDISMVIMELDIGPGSVIIEAGTGSGSLSHAFLRTIGSTGFLHTCDFHLERVDVAEKEFKSHGLHDRVKVSKKDVCLEGWGVTGIADAAFLDLPRPWDALKFAITAMKSSGGRICSFSPCIEQVTKTCQAMRNLGLTELKVLECLQREFQIRNVSLPSVLIDKVHPNKLKYIDKKKDFANSSSKKRKLEENEDKKMQTEDDVSDATEKPNPPVTEIINEADVNGSVNTSKTNNSDSDQYKFLAGAPVLKMPGHTGYLTFATVPPNVLCCLSELEKH